MIIFCYGRKSVFSDTSDSIDNQLRMCHEYCDGHFTGRDITYVDFSDEDFSGKDTARPDLRRMMERIRSGEADALAVYQLDRFTRSVRDFSNMYDVLNTAGVDFISVKESIDTSTPIGRAMMYIIVIFAQMERETTAVRVTDNMIGLARKGWWVGGEAPLGYKRQKAEDGGRKHVTIVPDPEAAQYVRGIFDYFLDKGCSLSGCERAMRKEGIHTLAGGFFSSTQLHRILTSPFGTAATPEVYDYFAAKGCQMADESPRSLWDGTHGVIVYGRSTEAGGRHVMQPPEKWTVSIGRHEPIMDAETWLDVQAQFGRNKFEKAKKHPVRLLKGTLRCKCGRLMRVSYKKKAHGYSAWYYCIRRERQGEEWCDMHMVKCDILDQKVIDLFDTLQADTDAIREYVLREAEPPAPVDPQPIRDALKKARERQRRITAALGYSDDEETERAIVEELKAQAARVGDLKQQLDAVLDDQRRAALTEAEITKRAEEIREKITGLSGFDADQRNRIVHEVLTECVWDGETLRIAF